MPWVSHIKNGVETLQMLCCTICVYMILCKNCVIKKLMPSKPKMGDNNGDIKWVIVYISQATVRFNATFFARPRIYVACFWFRFVRQFIIQFPRLKYMCW